MVSFHHDGFEDLACRAVCALHRDQCSSVQHVRSWYTEEILPPHFVAWVEQRRTHIACSPGQGVNERRCILIEMFGTVLRLLKVSIALCFHRR